MTRDVEPAQALIRKFEGLRHELYLCPAGVWTIGYGHAVSRNEPAARVLFPSPIGTGVAEGLLWRDVSAVASAIDRMVTVRLTNNQFCALISFVFNVGIGAFKRSTLLRKLNAGDYAAVPKELMRWTRGGGKVLPGLQRRREAEAKLWMTPDGDIQT